MLFLETSGYKYSKTLCEDVVTWFVKKFIPRHKIEIIVQHRGLLREGVYGWCSVTDCDHRPRCFLIEIHNRMSREEYIKTLLHELQHVFQHVRGDLRDKGSKRYWRGIDCSHLDYENEPWEIEAHLVESMLCEMYLTRV